MRVPDVSYNERTDKSLNACSKRLKSELSASLSGAGMACFGLDAQALGSKPTFLQKIPSSDCE